MTLRGGEGGGVKVNVTMMLRIKFVNSPLLTLRDRELQKHHGGQSTFITRKVGITV